MQLCHHDIQNKNLTFNSWLKIIKKMGCATAVKQGLESTCNLRLNETKRCYVWKRFSFFERFLMKTRLLQRIIRKFAHHLEIASLAFLVLLYPY